MIVHHQFGKKKRRKVAKSTKGTGQIQGPERREDTDLEALRTKEKINLKTERDHIVDQLSEEPTDTAVVVLTVLLLPLTTAPPSHHADKALSLGKMTTNLLATDPAAVCPLPALLIADLPHLTRMGTRVAVIMVTTIKAMASF